MSAVYKGKERRRGQRVAYTSEIWYRDYNKLDQGFKHAYGKNISQYGLFFEAYEIFPACTILELKLPVPYGQKIPSQGKSFMVLGEVGRSEEIKRPWLYCIAVSFCKIDDSFREILTRYVSDVSTQKFPNELAVK